MPKQTRNGSMDALKVLSIFLIILHHFALRTHWVPVTLLNPNGLPLGLSDRTIVIDTLLAGGKVGVDLFIMITGYFMIRSTAKLKSIVTVWVEATIISLLVLAVVNRFDISGQTFSMTLLIKALFPAVFAQYWFITAYTLLFFAIPWLNQWFLGLTDQHQRQALGWSFAILAGYATIYYRFGMTFSYVLWFFFLYLSGAYLRLHKQQVQSIATGKIWQWLGGVLVVGVILNVILAAVFAHAQSPIARVLTNFNWDQTMFYTRDASPWAFAAAVPVFMLFMRGHLQARRWLQYAARCAFAAYLLHDSAFLGQDFLWTNVVGARHLTANLAIVSTGLVSAVLIYFGSVIIFTCLFPLRQGLLRLLTPMITKGQRWFVSVVPAPPTAGREQ